MEDKIRINDPILAYRKKKEELAAIGEGIKGSVKKEVVLFVDLSDSTAIKRKISPEEWLDFIYGFIEAVSDRSGRNKGYVVKAIGDEIMLSFDLVSDAEQFIESLMDDPSFNEKYRYKIAADYGEVYHFQFEQSLALDPYGSVVDRCARIARLADAGAVLCSSSYASMIKSPSPYLSAVKIKLKGFDEASEIFIRISPKHVSSGEYLKPLIQKLNAQDRPCYRYTSRKFTESFFAYSPKSTVRPFLLRELLNVPKLPMSLPGFLKFVSSLENMKDCEDYIGFLVEWQGKFVSYEKKSEYITVQLKCDMEGWPMAPSVYLELLPVMYDDVRLLRKGQNILFRGILEEVRSFLWIGVNYVDIEIIDG
jgi:class 3 adenylate cyclase